MPLLATLAYIRRPSVQLYSSMGSPNYSTGRATQVLIWWTAANSFYQTNVHKALCLHFVAFFFRLGTIIDRILDLRALDGDMVSSEKAGKLSMALNYRSFLVHVSFWYHVHVLSLIEDGIA